VDRVKLVTASACSTAAVTAAEQLRLLGLGPAAADPAGAGAGANGAVAGGTGAAAAPVSALAVRLAERLDAAVLAMRFPVTDDFAVSLAEGLYDRVLGKGQPLPGALGLALPPLLAAERHPPISLAWHKAPDSPEDAAADLVRFAACLLARDLPRLRALMDGTAPGIGQDAGRALAARVLAMAQGHPRLLELADGQADDEPALRDFLAKAEWDVVGGVPEGFLSDGESAAGAADFARVLDGWTRSVAAELPPEAAAFFGFLCALEEQHRVRGLILMVWPLLWDHLRQPDPVWDQLWKDLVAGLPDGDGDGAGDPAEPDGGPAAGQSRFEDMAAAAPGPAALCTSTRTTTRTAPGRSSPGSLPSYFQDS
jgi:hypothetical protein